MEVGRTSSVFSLIPARLCRKARAGFFFGAIVTEFEAEPEKPKVKAAAFFDGQNLFRSAQKAFDVTHPNYDPIKLANLVCERHGLELVLTNFYTGIPDRLKSHLWHSFWSNKGLAMTRAGVKVFKRPIKYHMEEIDVPGHGIVRQEVPVEKGIDVRIALDMIKIALTDQSIGAFVLFSQDQDLSEAIDDIKLIGKNQNRMIDLYSAFPLNTNPAHKRGVNGTNWVQLDRAEYEKCVDPRDFRPQPVKRATVRVKY